MTFRFQDYNDTLLFVPLGGSNEIGMNLNLYRYRGKWLMIDLGIGFADDYLPGIEILMPNIDMLIPHRKDLVGLVLTHAHEDHLGAVPYLWSELRCPIYATPFTAAMLKTKLAEEGITRDVVVHPVKAGQTYNLAPFEFEMVPLTHSIPEMHAIAIRTPEGVVMHTGDWKLDSDPMIGPTSDEATLKKYGDEGVLAMVCDSTNVFVEGESGSESDVRTNLKELIQQCKNRVAVALFASNVARLESVVHAGLDAGRSIALVGKSLWRVLDAAQESGYLNDCPPFLTDKQAMELSKDQVLFICTGCQGEPRAALTKIVRNEHPVVRFSAGDTVIFSSRTIPGNEGKIGWLQNQMVGHGLEVIGDHNTDLNIHVSGHPARAELARMYQLVRPRVSVPVHGEARHIHEHAKLAKSLQVPEAVEATNGAVIQLKAGDSKIVGMTEFGYLAMDGTSVISADSPIIRARRKLRDAGCCIVSVVVDKHNKLLSDPMISTLGCLDEKEDSELINVIYEDVVHTVERQRKGVKEEQMSEAIRATIRKHLNKELGKKPVIDVHIHRAA